MIRVTENEITKWTRSGNILLNINHMDEELKLARMSITKDSEVIFDGELFIPNVAFKDLNGVLKSKPVDIDTLSGKAKDKAEKHERLLGKVQFNIFDIVTDEPFSQRISHLKIAFIGSKYKYLKEVDTRYVLTQEESDAAHKLFNNTYEGSMIRKPDGKYEHKRSKSLVKRKEFIDEEFEIVDVVPAEREPDLGLYVCQTTDGTRFNVTPKCTKKEKREILKNKDNFVGKKLTVKYQEKFENGIPRFGVGLRVREDV
jgi:ATP-dependent DNA ligase